MSPYYFGLYGGEGFHRDEFGDDFTPFDAARRQARSLLHDVMREDRPDSDLHTAACDVRDETGRVVHAVKLTGRETWGQI